MNKKLKQSEGFLLVTVLLGTTLLLFVVTAFMIQAMQAKEQSSIYRARASAELDMERVMLLLKAEIRYKLEQMSEEVPDPTGAGVEQVFRPKDPKSKDYWRFWEKLSSESMDLLPEEASRPKNNPLDETEWVNLFENTTGWTNIPRSIWRRLNCSQLGLDKPYANQVRYRFSVYEVGSKLNINIAGLAQGAQTDRLLSIGNIAQIDLYSNPKNDAEFLRQIQSFRWGRHEAGTSDEKQGIISFYNSLGFNKLPEGMNAFLDRSEFLDFCRSIGKYNSVDTFTIYSKDFNGPSATPTFNGTTFPTYKFKNLYTYNYKDEANNDFSADRRSPNRDLLNARDSEGKALLRKRFPLSRLTLIENATGAVGKDDNIYKYFGLTRASASAPWVYEHGTVDSNGNTKIYQLNDPAFLAEKRDPDFFELLQAGILAGSLGLTSDASDSAQTNRTSCFLEHKFLRPDLANHIFAIGANIIDQSDADSYPTMIQIKSASFSPQGIPADSTNYVLEGAPVVVTGQEAIPYISELVLVPFRISGSATLDYYLCFEVWNPYRTPTILPPTIKMRTVLKGGEVVTSGFRTVAPTPHIYTSPYHSNETSLNENDYYAEYLSSASGRRPWRFKRANELTGKSVNVEEIQFTDPRSGQFSFVGFKFPTQGLERAFEDPSAGNCYASLSLSKNEAKTIWIENQFLTKSGTWSTSQVLPGGAHNSTYSNTRNSGHASEPKTNPGNNFFSVNGSFLQAGSVNTSPAYYFTSPLIWGDFQSKWPLLGMNGGGRGYLDPRTGRVGMYAGTQTSNDDHMRINLNMGSIGTHGMAPGQTPNLNNGGRVFNVVTFKPAYLTDNKVDSSYYKDLDGVIRRGDGNSTLGVYPNDYSRESDKPVVLNRPFVSVAEMGYAYRDLPWKSLNFFSSDSADAALLDLFCINDDEEITSGKIDINLADRDTFKTLLEGRPLDPTFENPVITKSDSIASALEQKANGEFLTRAELATRLAEFYPEENDPDKSIKARREGIVRSLVDSSQTRTLNLMVALVVQIGPERNNFFKLRAQNHRWIHLAFDRFTNKFIDEEWEYPEE